jgi:hypothetical protein
VRGFKTVGRFGTMAIIFPQHSFKKRKVDDHKTSSWKGEYNVKAHLDQTKRKFF